MRIEHEWRDAEGEDGEPEVDQVWDPDGHRRVQQEQQVTHAHVDTRRRETRVEDVERYPTRRETTTCSDVARTTEAHVVQERLRVDLGGEHFENGRQ